MYLQWTGLGLGCAGSGSASVRTRRSRAVRYWISFEAEKAKGKRKKKNKGPRPSAHPLIRVRGACRDQPLSSGKRKKENKRGDSTSISIYLRHRPLHTMDPTLPPAWTSWPEGREDGPDDGEEVEEGGGKHGRAPCAAAQYPGPESRAIIGGFGRLGISEANYPAAAATAAAAETWGAIRTSETWSAVQQKII